MPPPFCVVPPCGVVGFVGFCCPVDGLFPPPVVGVPFVEAGAGFAGAAVVVGFAGVGAGVGFAGGGGGGGDTGATGVKRMGGGGGGAAADPSGDETARG